VRKDHELALIYGRYQNELIKLGLYDSEGQFWTARALVEQEHWGPFQDVAFIVVDGFTDFTHAQYEILKHLARRAARMLISLPSEEPYERSDLFAKSEKARQRLIAALSPEATATIDRTRRRIADDRPAFDHIADFLFANPRRHVRLPCAEGIEIVAAAGQLGEVEFLASRVKRLLLQGTSADEIVVAFRSLEDYGDLVDEVFRAAGIPFECATNAPLSREPLWRAIVALLQLEVEDWPYERLTSVLSSNYFRPAWRERHKGRAAGAVGAELRRLGLVSGRNAILDALERASRGTGADSASGGGASGGADSTLAYRWLRKLSLVTEPLRKRAGFGAWVDTVVAVATDLGIPLFRRRRVDREKLSPVDRRDFDAWTHLTERLFHAAALERMRGAAHQELTLAEFLSELGELTKLPGPRPRPPRSAISTSTTCFSAG
jgi:hypothetical protein